MFKNPERYFEDCENCGECCRVPAYCSRSR